MEYALILILVAVVVILILTQFGEVVFDTYCYAADELFGATERKASPKPQGIRI